MFLSPIDLTTALRPSLLPDETLLFVQDSVGLYEGKHKLAGYQAGHAYLTTHRACYIDNEEPRKRAVAVNLKDVDRSEYYAGFLKSSAKVTLYAKPPKNISLTPRLSSPNNGTPEADSSIWRGTMSMSTSSSVALVNATWICPICTFSNPVPSNFDPVLANDSTPLPPCLTCGIKPPLHLVVKAAVSSLANRALANTPPRGHGLEHPLLSHDKDEGGFITCPRCTFQNDASLLSCEICGASLGSTAANSHRTGNVERLDSPGPFSSFAGQQGSEFSDSVKFSFRAGGDKIFHERLKNALIQRKWLLQSAPAVPRHGVNERNTNANGSSSSTKAAANIGIAGLEKRGTELRKNNELVIGNAFEDLAALMASAKEIIAVAEQFSSQARPASNDVASNSSYGSSTSDPATLLAQMNLSTTKDMLSPSGSISSSANTLYLTELSRQLAEYLTDDRTGILRSEGGIISLVDLWAVFNRARGGVELISPTDFANAAELFEKLQLPLRLRRFKSGLLVVQGKDRTDEKTITALLGWLKSLRAGGVVGAAAAAASSSSSSSSSSSLPSSLRANIASPVNDAEDPFNGYVWGRGVTALEAADHFGWSVGVATEELEMAEERGAVCREVGLEGVRFWENWLVVAESEHLRKAI